MLSYLRNKPAWTQLIVFGGLTVGLIALSAVLGVSIVAHFNHLSVSQVVAMKPADYARPELAGVVRGMLVLNSVGIFLLPPLVFAYLADPHPLTYLGIRPAQRNSFFLLAAVTMIVAYFTVEFMGMINEYIVFHLPKAAQAWIQSGEDTANGALENILSMKNARDLVVVIFLVGVLPAIGEELFFRGVLQRLFIQIFKSPWPGIIFTGFLFSVFHMQFMGFLPRMALGIILGALYWYSGSILASMLGHFIYNTINIFLIYFKWSEVNSKTGSSLSLGLIGLVSLLLIVVLLYQLRKKSTISYAMEYPPIRENTPFDDTGEKG